MYSALRHWVFIITIIITIIIFIIAMDWMFVSLPNSYVEVLNLNAMVLGHEGVALMNGISTLIKETPKS